MKTAVIALTLFAILLLAPIARSAEEDAREAVAMPAMMKDHMLGNMRDHLRALHEIQAALAKGDLDRAGDIAEARIGMSSLASHNAAHMAPYMPNGMQTIGTNMHHAASRFAITAKEGDLPKALEALSRISEQCVACHAAYRLK